MSGLLIKNGRVIDPANGLDGQRDVLLEKGEIRRVAKKINAPTARVIDAKGKWVTPGLVDIHVHLREPGHEYKETIRTGAMSAAVGGFTSLACMANTTPVNDCAAVTRFILDKARAGACVNVYPVGAVTRGLKGEALADIGEMARMGVVALSDDGKCVRDAGLLRNAMEYSSMFGLVIMEHAEDPQLVRGGCVNEGEVSTSMGLPGAPVSAEDTIVARDVALAEYLDVPVHFCHISTAGAVEIIRRAKEKGVKVTAESAGHHFTLTHEEVRGYRTNAKMSPPLRTQEDVEAVRSALAQGVIDCIASDHAPHCSVEKDVEFEDAAFGVVGLETSLGLALALVHEGLMTPMRLVEAMSTLPAHIIGIEAGTLSTGAPADVTITDPDVEWTVNPAQFKSKSVNTPFAGRKMKGKAAFTIVKGKIVYQAGTGADGKGGRHA